MRGAARAHGVGPVLHRAGGRVSRGRGVRHGGGGPGAGRRGGGHVGAVAGRRGAQVLVVAGRVLRVPGRGSAGVVEARVVQRVHGMVLRAPRAVRRVASGVQHVASANI